MIGNPIPPKQVQMGFNQQPSGAKKPQEMYKNPFDQQVTTKAVAFEGFEKVKQERYNEIYAHEAAHKAAGGSQAGSINIEYDNNGVAFAGHVNIRFHKAVNKANPMESYNSAKVAFASATAVPDMSAADSAVAAQASSVMSESQFFMNSDDFKMREKGVGQKLNMLG